MVQSYLVLEEDNKKLNSNREVFDWLVDVLNKAISAEDASQDDLIYNDIEVLQVRPICCRVLKLYNAKKTSQFKTQCKNDVSHAFKAAKVTVFHPVVCTRPDVPL